MSKHYHMPLSRKDEASILILNQRFSQLDRAIVDFISQTTDRLTVTAGENIADRDAVYLDLSDNKIYRIDAAGLAIGAIRGFADGAALEDDSGTLVLAGILDGFSDLSAWMPVFAGTAAGSISQTRPEAYFGASQIMLAEMGFAVAADTIYIQPKPVEYKIRAAISEDETLTLNHHTAIGYQRKLMAYFTDVIWGSTIISYADSNLDNGVELRASVMGETVTITASGDTATIGDVGGNDFRGAQSFLLSTIGVLDEITVRLTSNSGSPTGNITWEIRPDRVSNPGRPDDSIVLASDSFTPVPSSDNVIAVSGTDRVQLTPGLYWLILIAPAQSSNNAYRWQVSSSLAPDVYADGYYASANNSNPTSWTPANLTDAQMSVTTDSSDLYDKLAQTFTLAELYIVGEARLWLKRVGSPSGMINLRLETTSGGSPTGTLVDPNAIASFPESALGTSYGEVLLSFAGSFFLPAGVYALVLSTSRAASATDYIVWGCDASAPSFADGEMKGEVSSAWGSLGKDAIFALNDPSIYYPSRIKADHWESTNADMVNRYGDVDGAEPDTQSSFKCLRPAGFADVTLSVVLD